MFASPQRTRIPRRRHLRLILALWGTLAISVPVGAPAEPVEVLVSEPGAPVQDPDFYQNGDLAQFTWVDPSGTIWFGRIDPATGNFVPPSGRAAQVTTGAASVLDTGNGPVWVYTASGPQIVYSAYNSQNQFAIGRARTTDGGLTWQAGILPGGNGRVGPIGSLDAGDRQPRIAYANVNSVEKQFTQWRYLDRAESEGVVPNSLPTGGRWVPGQPALALTEKVPGTSIYQAYKYDIDAGVLERLTYDSGGKKSIFFWQAPEYNNETLFMTLTDGTSVGIYRQIGGTWKKINTLKPPTTNKYIWSPQPWVYNGKSYISLVSSPSPSEQSLTVLTSIWIAGIDPAVPFYAQISPDTERVRKNPKVFFTTTGAILYYQILNEAAVGIYRASTGLGPPR